MKVIKADKAPKAIGPYSQGVILGEFIFTSGQIPLNPSTNEIVGVDVEAQARQVFENLRAVLQEGGSDLACVIKTTLFIKDMNDFAKINAVYGEYFKEPYPARSCVEVARLPKDVLIEVEAIARVGKGATK